MKAFVRIAAEINLKSNQVRKQFLNRLTQNLSSGLRENGFEARVQRSWGRLFVECDDPSAFAVIGRVPGVSSYSIVEHECEPNMEAMIATATQYYQDKVEGKSFAVRVHRGDVDGFRSIDVERQVGAALYEKARCVDLEKPEVSVKIEARREGAFFYSEKIAGVGGLPIGVEGRALCLISGGFDSAVAAWYLLRRGVELDFIFFNLAGGAYEKSVLQVTKFLCEHWGMGYRPRVHVVGFEDVLKNLHANVTPRFLQVVLKRLMYRLSSKVALDTGCAGLVTGECIGQVSSQTLHNLQAIETAASLPVFRPLIGFDKEEIIRKARDLETYSLCEQIQEYCNLNPKHPVTKAKVADAEDEESRVDSDCLDQALDARKCLDIKSISASELVTEYVYVDRVFEGATVIDCRSRAHHKLWHYPGSRCIELEKLTKDYKKLSKSDTYILYCPVGLQSAVVAEKMQRSGYEAYSFRGGIRELRKQLL